MHKPYRHDCLVLAIPAYNEERYIADAIASVKAQSWTNFLALVSDNASTDRTEEICRREIAGDARFVYVRQAENRGAATNFNWVLEQSESPLFMWLGAHDMISPDFLEGHVAALTAHPEYSLSYSLTQWIDETGTRAMVTDPSNLGDLRGGRWTRYFGSIRRLRECTAINNVLRREMLGSLKIEKAHGADKVMLSEMLFRGPANRIERPQYFRRLFAERAANYAERLTGNADLELNESDLVPQYMANFDGLSTSVFSKLLIRPLLKSLLRRKFCRKFETIDYIYIPASRLFGL